MKELILKRIYDPPAPDDGYRILVDRLWPRGISKEKAALDEWDKELAPSAELRKWFGHKEELFEEFASRYREELSQRKEELKRLKSIAEQKKVCLLYGAKDEKHNQAVVLKSVLESL